MPRREKLNEEHLIKRVRETRGETRKVKWLSRRGAPDRYCGWPTRGVGSFVEVKEENQPWGLQDHQCREHQFMRACGLDVVVLGSREQIDQWIRLKTGQ